MADIMFVGKNTQTSVRFAAEPVFNALCSLCLLSQDHLDNISSWVDATKQHMNDEERAQAEWACHAIPFVKALAGASIDEWLPTFRALDPAEIFRVNAERLRVKALLELDQETVPGIDELMGDRTTYVNLARELQVAKGYGAMFKQEEEEQTFDEMSGGAVYRDKLANGIEHLWERYLKAEWPRVRDTVETSVKAFRSIQIPGDTLINQVTFITERDPLPEQWIPTLQTAREIVFIPSVHIGPFMILLDYDGTTAYIAGRARIPEGSTVQAAELNRSELLIRLDALSDESRLRILELAVGRGTVTTQEVMDALELSQSSASRHLTQLTATGLLSVDASERTKRYRLNARRIDTVCNDLKKLLGPGVRE